MADATIETRTAIGLLAAANAVTSLNGEKPHAPSSASATYLPRRPRTGACRSEAVVVSVVGAPQVLGAGGVAAYVEIIFSSA